MSYNADGQNSVSIDLSSAAQAHATVTTFFDHVEVYQHASPGVRINFYFDKYDLKNNVITGTAKSAAFETDPLTVNVSTGKVGRVTQSAKISLIAKIPKRSMISTLSKMDYGKPNNETGYVAAAGASLRGRR